MDAITMFITQNYLWFLVIAIFLLLALIGYFVDTKLNSVDSPFRRKKQEIVSEVKIDQEALNSAEGVSLNTAIGNMQQGSLGDVVAQTAEDFQPANMDMGVEQDNQNQTGVNSPDAL